MLEKCYTVENEYRIFHFGKCLQYLNYLGRQKYGHNFHLRPADKLILHKLISYAISSEEQCAVHDLDLKKGILLTGPVGCGKTSLMTLLPAFMFNFQRYQVKETRQIAAEFNKDGFEVIHKYGMREKAFCLDDLGVEHTTKHFGNECNTVAEILLQRYDLFANQGIVTHATTNLNADELEAIYGVRVRSRLRAMFNLISFPIDTCDKRK